MENYDILRRESVSRKKTVHAKRTRDISENLRLHENESDSKENKSLLAGENFRFTSTTLDLSLDADSKAENMKNQYLPGFDPAFEKKHGKNT